MAGYKTNVKTYNCSVDGVPYRCKAKYSPCSRNRLGNRSKETVDIREVCVGDSKFDILFQLDPGTVNVLIAQVASEAKREFLRDFADGLFEDIPPKDLADFVGVFNAL